MKLIDKHLLREYLLPLAYCFCGFAMLFIVAGLFERGADFLRAGMPIRDFVRFYAYYVISYADRENVSSVVRILPAAVLAATLYSLAMLTKHNELIALRASGVSIHRLMLPFLAVGLACSLLGVYVQEFAAPRASRIVDELDQEWRKKANPGRNQPYRSELAGRTWRMRTFDVNNPNVASGVVVTVERKTDGGISDIGTKIKADKAEWRDNMWWFYGKSTQEYGAHKLPKGGWSPPEAGPVPMPGLTEKPINFVVAAQISTLERYEVSITVLRHLRDHGGLPPAELARRQVDAHRRLAMPWACLVVALLGVPIAARNRRQGSFVGILTSVSFFLLYFVTIYVSAFLGKTQVISPGLSAWLPNISFFIAGLAMTIKMK